MNRFKFNNMMYSGTEKEKVDCLTIQDVADILKKNLETAGEDVIKVIAMEELSELIKEISKSIRNENRKIDILEEMADVTLILTYLSLIYHIDDRELEQALRVKTAVLVEKMEERDGCSPL